MTLCLTVSAQEENNTGFAQDENDKGTTIGIDSVTTYSCVGAFKNGRVEIIANDQGNRITPSYVAFVDGGTRLVGDAAKNQATINPANTAFDVKRLIGRNYSDESVQADKNLSLTVLFPTRTTNRWFRWTLVLESRPLLPRRFPP